MIFVKNSKGGRGVNMIYTLSKINLSKIGWEGGGSTSIWIMSLNILLLFFEITPYCIDIYQAFQQRISATFNLDIELGHWSWTFYQHKNRIIEPVHWAFTLSFYLFIEQKFKFICIHLLYFGNNTTTFHGLKRCG